METFSSFIVAVMIFGLVAGVIAIVLSGASAAYAKEKNFRESLARRLQGRYLPASLVSHPCIEFSMAGRNAVVEFVPAQRSDQGRTWVAVPLQCASPGTLHIVHAGFNGSFLEMFGAQDISIGDPAFDAAYVVRATPPSLAAQVFSPHRRSRVIAAVRRLEFLRRPAIELTRDQLRIQVHEEVRGEVPAMQLVKTAEEFLEFLPLKSPVTGIELADVKIAVDTGCPVCGTTLGATAVRCESCRTPHHSECWTYVGQCSTYACKGKRWSA